jgi:predicted Zn-dependent protease with MMP-like domain
MAGGAMAYHVSKTRFAELVERALEELPPAFADFLEEVPVQIEDQPSPRLLRELGLHEDDRLFGVYHGADFMTRSETEGRGSPLPNHILIFQDDIEEVCANEAELVREVRTTVLHEIGHHFGMDEDDLDELGYG